jgi:CDP-paratose 2-epimerase
MRSARDSLSDGQKENGLMKLRGDRKVLVTGGAGFIGSNLVERLLSNCGTRVRILDNLSRPGVTRNLDWLRAKADGNLEVIEGDVRDTKSVASAVAGVSEIYHLAAQVAVTSSVQDPWTDFQVNAIGTFNVLEAARRSTWKPFLLFTSTNKVYGALESISVVGERTRYRAKEAKFFGVSEAEPLDFHSPYGCSKGTADQYVRDYARIYGLPTVVFRMSCIAGPRQFGNEDQGWVAHFLYSVLENRSITIYGDGLQVRDVLHVQDLVDAMLLAREHVDVTRGNVYNVGGGPKRAISILEMLRTIEAETGIPVRLTHGGVRPGDQPLYISDTRKLEQHTNWHARRTVARILTDIHEFWKAGRGSVGEPLAQTGVVADRLRVVA